MPAKAIAARSALKPRAEKGASTSKVLRARPSRSSSQASGSESDFEEPRQTKRRRIGNDAKSNGGALSKQLFGTTDTDGPPNTCTFPGRIHTVSYHRPLLLDTQNGRESRDALLKWFDSISTKRGMPWRKPWLGAMPDADPIDRRKA